MKWVRATAENVPRKPETGRIIVKWTQPNGFKILEVCPPQRFIAWVKAAKYEYFFLDTKEINWKDEEIEYAAVDFADEKITDKQFSQNANYHRYIGFKAAIEWVKNNL